MRIQARSRAAAEQWSGKESGRSGQHCYRSRNCGSGSAGWQRASNEKSTDPSSEKQVRDYLDVELYAVEQWLLSGQALPGTVIYSTGEKTVSLTKMRFALG